MNRAYPVTPRCLQRLGDLLLTRQPTIHCRHVHANPAIWPIETRTSQRSTRGTGSHKPLDRNPAKVAGNGFAEVRDRATLASSIGIRPYARARCDVAAHAGHK